MKKTHNMASIDEISESSDLEGGIASHMEHVQEHSGLIDQNRLEIMKAETLNTNQMNL